MDAIVTLSLLNTLKLDHCNQITSRGFEVLSSLRDLSTLSLTNVHLTDEKLERIALSITSLQKINIEENSYITDKGFQQSLPFLSHLSCLKVGVCQVTDYGWRYATHLKNLETLKILGSTNLTNSGLHFLTSLSNLHSLTLAYCDQLNDTMLSVIQKLNSLTRLELLSLNLTRKTVNLLSQTLTSLSHLSVKKCYPCCGDEDTKNE
jgi:hypothetical protein